MSIVLNAESREDMGKGASRRLRRANKLPAIVYGAGKDPENLTLEQKEVLYHLQNEAFYTQVLELNVGGKKQDVLLRDLQHHPFRQDILHMDLQRVEAKKEVHVNVPLHFINEDIAPGVKQEGGAISHVVTEVVVACLPKDIPEFIDVDLSELHIGEIVHLSDLKMPAGVEVLELRQGEEHDSAIASLHARKVAEEPEAIEEAGGAAEEAEPKEEGGESED
ncbi:MAG: 50S ribosomal protein L25/general stress protein Ctc [Gammaproteobacteria bacterium]|nr:50S ribosomal protein L25/general stress protein Ctc [Gammaproteobacteria bacterium]